MIAPMLVVQIVVLLFVLVGLGMVAYSMFANGLHSEDRGGFLLFGGLVAVIATLCLWAMAESAGPSCRLSPASVVEGIAP